MGAYIDPRSPEHEAREPMLRSPAVVNICIAVLALVHAGSQLLSDEQYQWVIANFALIPQKIGMWLAGGLGFYEYALAVTGSLFTHALLHANLEHLIANTLWILAAGTIVARRVGPARFLAILAVTTLGAALAFVLAQWGSQDYAIGASGATSGLMGCVFRVVFIDPKGPPGWPPPCAPLFSHRVLLASAVFVAINLVFGLSGMSAEGFFSVAVAWEAHLGGYFTGLVLFPLFDRRRTWLS